MCLADVSLTFDPQFFHPASFSSVGTDVEICRYPVMEREMNLKNVLMIGPKSAFGDLAAQPDSCASSSQLMMASKRCLGWLSWA